MVLSTQFTRKYHYRKDIICSIHGLCNMTSKIHLSDYNSSISEVHSVMREDHFEKEYLCTCTFCKKGEVSPQDLKLPRAGLVCAVQG